MTDDGKIINFEKARHGSKSGGRITHKMMDAPFALASAGKNDGPSTIHSEKKLTKRLTPQQERFVEFLMTEETPETAAQKAGVKAADLKKWASQTMRLPNVAEAIRKNNAKLIAKRLTPDYINERIIALLENPHTPPATQANLLNTAARVSGMMNEGGAGNFVLNMNLTTPDGQAVDMRDILKVSGSIPTSPTDDGEDDE